MQNLKQLLNQLLQSKIDFVLVGGFAAVVHGATTVTQDLDICAALTEDQILRLRGLLKDLHPTHRMNPKARLSFLSHPQDLKNVRNIYLETDLGILDIMSELPPIGAFEDVKKRSVEVSLYGHRCRVISLEDLIKVKESMNRSKDLQMAKELRIIQRKTTDSL